jgi:hypothetical protein
MIDTKCIFDLDSSAAAEHNTKSSSASFATETQAASGWASTKFLFIFEKDDKEVIAVFILAEMPQDLSWFTDISHCCDST